MGPAGQGYGYGITSRDVTSNINGRHDRLSDNVLIAIKYRYGAP